MDILVWLSEAVDGFMGGELIFKAITAKKTLLMVDFSGGCEYLELSFGIMADFGAGPQWQLSNSS
jgi:hypothetical protein